MIEPSAPSLMDYERPDWSAAAADDLRCPLCEYNLRGLNEPRCPECGYAFAWRDLLDPARRTHPYLIEHHRGGRAFRAFWVTAFMCLRPRRFWSTLRPDQVSRPRRLIAFWTIAACIATLGTLSNLALRGFANYQQTFTVWGGRRVYYIGITPRSALPYVFICAVVVGWPVLTFLALGIFQISMARAKVKQVHVLRCAVYASAILFWTGLAMLAWNAGRAVLMVLGVAANTYDPKFDHPLFAWWFAGAAFVYAMLIAYWKYLRFQHVVATVLAAQVIVFLAMFTAMLWIAVSSRS